MDATVDAEPALSTELASEATFDLNALLLTKRIDPRQVLVLLHRSVEPRLYRALPRLADEKPDVFNAYQQTQTKNVEKALARAAYVASFIGHEPRKALFVGLYSVGASRPITLAEYWQIPAYIEMKDQYGLKGWTEDDERSFARRRSTVLWFDLALTEFYANWKGKLIVEWPPPEISWSRWAHKNTMPVFAILEESALEPVMQPWNEIALNTEEINLLGPRWRAKLAEWRGVYYIVDSSDRKAYCGSAYGVHNILGRWLAYAASGHGGNVLLRQRDPKNFQFAILERVSPDMPPDEVIRLEATWKRRLNTYSPNGLNDN